MPARGYDLHGWPRLLTHERGTRTGLDGRDTARRRQHPARRPRDRTAHQDGAERPERRHVPAHGDVRLPVIAPGNVEECFYAAVAAINWAERYQGPVVLLSEHALSERQANIPKPDLSRLVIEDRVVYRGDNGYQRYEGDRLTPMPIPGSPEATLPTAASTTG